MLRKIIVVLVAITLLLPAFQVVQAQPFKDWGDAPDGPYPTLSISNGAWHNHYGIAWLGASIDADIDGQPNATATGDDNDGNDDEDGVVFTTLLEQGVTVTVTVTSTVGWLNAWIDFNGDGDWADTGEHIFSDLNVAAGAKNLGFWVPAGATPGTTYARFRFSSQDPWGGLSYDGMWETGEVEDYEVVIHERDWGDAPDSIFSTPYTYHTLQTHDGANHIIVTGVYLGAVVDGELDGQPNQMATGDDIDTDGDDEDGVVFTSALIPSQQATVTVEASIGGYLNAWIDFDGNGNWSGTNEQIFSDRNVWTGSNSLTFTVPSWAITSTTYAITTTYARFRFTRDKPWGTLSYTDTWSNGEVEDYEVVIDDPANPDGRDWGDAPDPTYPTLAGNIGANHVIGAGVYLGAGVDAEPNGQPDPNALGDDKDGNDDEDGVVFTSLLEPGVVATVEVTASMAGWLNAWIDFNGDGDWDEANEHIFADMNVTMGLNSLTFNVPAGATPGTTYARFRFTDDNPMGTLSYDDSWGNGEVEDYEVTIPTTAVPVGGYVMLVSKAELLAPWVGLAALAGLLLTCAIVVASRRVRNE